MTPSRQRAIDPWRAAGSVTHTRPTSGSAPGRWSAAARGAGAKPPCLWEAARGPLPPPPVPRKPARPPIRRSIQTAAPGTGPGNPGPDEDVCPYRQ